MKTMNIQQSVKKHFKYIKDIRKYGKVVEGLHDTIYLWCENLQRLYDKRLSVFCKYHIIFDKN